MAAPALGAWFGESSDRETGFRVSRGRRIRRRVVVMGTPCASRARTVCRTRMLNTMGGGDGHQYLVELKGQNTPLRTGRGGPGSNRGGESLEGAEPGRRKKKKHRNERGKMRRHLARSSHWLLRKSAPYCVLSMMTGAESGLPGDTTTPITRVPHRDELILMHDKGVDFTRLAMSRSVQFCR